MQSIKDNSKGTVTFYKWFLKGCESFFEGQRDCR